MLRPMPSGAKDPPRCLIVDDHPVVRAGVRAVLQDAFDGARILDAASVDDALEVLGGDSPDVASRPVEGRPRIANVVGRLAAEVGAPIVVFTSDGGARLLARR